MLIIDGEEFKKTQTDKISEKILEKCNWNGAFKNIILNLIRGN